MFKRTTEKRMFTNIGFIWLINIFMVGFIIMVCVKLFSHIHPFRFLEHKATVGGLLFISIITIITLIESIFMYIHVSHQREAGNFFFSFLAFASFACAIWTILPDIYSERSSVSFTLSFYSLFLGVAAFLEILATIIFYLSWTHL
jgi:hypothetical protein